MSAPGFLVRLTQLPFNPRLWSEARGWTVGEVLVPLLVLSLVTELGVATYRWFDMRKEARAAADRYDAQFDPVVIEGSVVRVEGTRLPRWSDGQSLVLVDPEETVGDAELEGKKFAVLRRSSLLDNGSGFRRETKVNDLMSVLDVPTLRIDGAALRGWVDRWEVAALWALLGLTFVFGPLADALVLPLFALAGGAFLGMLKGKALGLTSAHTFRIALATLAVRPVLSALLHLLGTGVDGCLGLFAWPALSVALGALALSRAPGPTAAAPSASA